MQKAFPGMNPFLEGDSWQDFHLRFIGVLAELLTPSMRPRYVVRARERVYLDHTPNDEMPDFFGPDVSIVEERGAALSSRGGGAATTLAVEPAIVSLPMPALQREHYLTILWRETLEVVTILELLSPANKRRDSDGREEYLEKRDAVLMSKSHLVEIDLLRGGERLPTMKPLPAGDYYAIVSRARRRPFAAAYGWPLFQRMPPIPVPLRRDDPDVVLDLQAVFDTVYARSDYDYSLDYTRQLRPPLGETDAARVKDALAGAR